MGFISGLVGGAGGANGTGFAAPQGTNIQQPTTAGQAGQAYNQSQSALQQQQQLVNALNAQNGLGNQSQVYGQLQGVANGTGPNPAQAMLNQQTGQNVANQSALMAGQRGSGANVGLMARQAAMQGANTQQQAVGQGATMQANQSLNALGQMGSMANTQAGQQISGIGALNSANQSEQQNLLNGLQGQNNSLVGMQSNVNSANAGLANTTMQGQQALLGGALGGLGSGAGMMGGGAQSAGASGVGAAAAAKGGMVMAAADGAAIPSIQSQPAIQPLPIPTVQTPQQTNPSGPQSRVAQTLRGMSQGYSGGNTPPLTKGMTQFGAGLGSFFRNASAAPTASSPVAGNSMQEMNALPNQAIGGSSAASYTDLPDSMVAPALPTTGADMAPQSAAPMAPAQAAGGMPMKPMPPGPKQNMKSGGGVPGTPKVGGAKNTLKNDTVPAVLSPGEIVIPRNITQGKDPAGEAAKFVQAVMMKKGGGHPLRGMSK